MGFVHNGPTIANTLVGLLVGNHGIGVNQTLTFLRK